jgi:iron complex outermembrane recepter protein
MCQPPPAQWNAEADYSWNLARFYSVSPPTLSPSGAAAVANGTLDVLRDTKAFPLDFTPYLNAPFSTSSIRSTLKDSTLRFAGPVGALPGGAPTLSWLFEHRDEEIPDAFSHPNATLTQVIPARSQTIDSLYGEVKLPIVSAKNEVRGVELLELQLSGRRDEYTIHGGTGIVVVGSTTPIVHVTDKVSSIDPTIGLRYQPMEDLMFRASYGTGFVPPTLGQLAANAPTSAGQIIDPRRGNQPSVVQGIFGGNANLTPEKSKSSSAGVVLTPRFTPGLRLSIDYVRIKKTNNIANPNGQLIVDNEAVLPGRVSRGPVPSGDPFAVGPITFIDATAANLSQSLIEAYNLSIDYQKQTDRFGRFDFYALATRQPHLKTQVAPAAPFLETVGISTGALNALKFKANAGITWKYHAWTLSWTADYFDSYLVTDPTLSSSLPRILNQGSRFVSSQIYHDVFASYKWNDSPSAFRWLQSVEVQAGIRNVFNTRPPFDAGNSAYFYSYLGDPRLATYYVTLSLSLH